MKQKLTIVLLCVLVVGCAPRIYTANDFPTALALHRKVAILPAEVSIQLRPKDVSKMTSDQIADVQQRTGYDIQEKMQGWFMRRSDKFGYTVSFQDINKTNALLKDAGIAYADLKFTDRAQLAKILGVDAVMQDRLSMEKPMSEGAAVVVFLLVGAIGNTNKVSTTINIHDGVSGDLLWKYDYFATGSLGSSASRLVDALMRNATKKFPYKVAEPAQQ